LTRILAADTATSLLASANAIGKRGLGRVNDNKNSDVAAFDASG